MAADIALSETALRRLELLEERPRAYQRNDPHNRILAPAGLIEPTGNTDGVGRPGWRITPAGRGRLFRERKKGRKRPIVEPVTPG